MKDRILSDLNGFAGKRGILFSVILIAVLGFCVYSNSVSGKFVWDDEHLVDNNPYIKKISFFPYLFTKNMGEASETEYSSYRPVQMMTYMAGYLFWKQDARGYHIVNILFHVFASLGVFWLVLVLWDDRILALIAGLLFVSHPVHVGAVAYISGRADPLSLFLMLLCFILYVKNLQGKSRAIYILIPLVYALAVLSRENVLIFPLLVLSYSFSFKKRIDLKAFVPITAITLIYSVIRLTVFSSFLTLHTSGIALLQRLPGAFAALTGYVRLLLLPFGLHMEYGNSLFSPSDPRVIAGAFIACGILVCAFLFRNKSRLVSFSAFWFLIGLLPVFHFVPLGAYMAEHWLYLPSVGWFMLLGGFFAFLCRSQKHRFLAVSFVIFIVAGYSLLTFRQNDYWREPVTFYERTLRYAPDSPRMLNNLGNIYQKRGETDKAAAMLKMALRVDSDQARTYNNLGILYSESGRNEEAIDAYEKALSIDPGKAKTYNNLANVYDEIGEHEKAIDNYLKSLELNPDGTSVYYNLGIAYNNAGMTDKAISVYLKAIDSEPYFEGSYLNLGVIYERNGRFEEAEDVYKSAIRRVEDSSGAYNNLGNVYSKQGHHQKAIELYNRQIEISPADNKIPYINLGRVYLRSGMEEEALSAFKKAIEKGADAPSLYIDVGVSYMREGRYADAIRIYEDALRIDPGNGRVYNNLGTVYARMGDMGKALIYFNKALEVDPDDVLACNNLAVLYRNTGEQEKAISMFQKAIKMDPKNIRAYNYLGQLYSLKGDSGAAETMFKKAVEIEPRSGTAYMNLSRLYLDSGKEDLAARYCELAQERGYKVSSEYLGRLEEYRRKNDKNN